MLEHEAGPTQAKAGGVLLAVTQRFGALLLRKHWNFASSSAQGCFVAEVL